MLIFRTSDITTWMSQMR